MTGPLFTRDALAPLRAANAGALTSSVRAEQLTLGTSTGGGANTGPRAWSVTPSGRAIPCRLSPIAPGQPSAGADQTSTLTGWLLTTDTDAPQLEPGMRVTVTGTNTETLEVWQTVLIVRNRRNPRTYGAMHVYECRDASPGERA